MALCLLSFAAVTGVRGHLLVLWPASLLLGASFGSFWPSLTARLYDYLPNGQGFVGGLIVIASVLGGAASLTLAGWLGDVFSLQQALLIAPVCAVGYGVLYRSVSAQVARQRMSNLP